MRNKGAPPREMSETEGRAFEEEIRKVRTLVERLNQGDGLHKEAAVEIERLRAINSRESKGRARR